MSNWCLWVSCHGEVHETGADGCTVCLGHSWGRLTACPRCLRALLTKMNEQGAGVAGTAREGRYVLLPSKTRRTGQCPSCLDRLSVSRVPPELKTYELDVWFSRLVNGLPSGRLVQPGYSLEDAQMLAWDHSPFICRVTP